MSYILEALKKGESERRSGTSDAAPLPPGVEALKHKPHASTNRLRLQIGLPLLFAALAGTAYIAFREEPPSVAIAEPVGPPQHTAALPTPATPAAPAPSPLPAAASAIPATPPEKPKEKIAKKNPDKKQLATIPEKTAKPMQAAQADKDDDHIVMLRDLPEQIQREIPVFTIGGYIYSGNRADRSVLINNRLLREGDEIAPGLALEQMTPNGMVLSYKGHRYRRSY